MRLAATKLAACPPFKLPASSMSMPNSQQSDHDQDSACISAMFGYQRAGDVVGKLFLFGNPCSAPRDPSVPQRAHSVTEQSQIAGLQRCPYAVLQQCLAASVFLTLSQWRWHCDLLWLSAAACLLPTACCQHDLCTSSGRKVRGLQEPLARHPIIMRSTSKRGKPRTEQTHVLSGCCSARNGSPTLNSPRQVPLRDSQPHDSLQTHMGWRGCRLQSI